MTVGMTTHAVSKNGQKGAGGGGEGAKNARMTSEDSARARTEKCSER
jgi:hypothetical protein